MSGPNGGEQHRIGRKKYNKGGKSARRGQGASNPGAGGSQESNDDNGVVDSASASVSRTASDDSSQIDHSDDSSSNASEDDDGDGMNGETNTGDASTTVTIVTGGSGGTAGGVVAAARRTTGSVEATKCSVRDRKGEDESAELALARAEIRSGQKMSEQDWKLLAVSAARKKIFWFIKILWKGKDIEEFVKELLRFCLKVPSRKAFELVVWPVVEHDTREAIRIRRQLVSSSFQNKIVASVEKYLEEKLVQRDSQDLDDDQVEAMKKDATLRPWRNFEIQDLRNLGKGNVPREGENLTAVEETILQAIMEFCLEALLTKTLFEKDANGAEEFCQWVHGDDIAFSILAL